MATVTQGIGGPLLNQLPGGVTVTTTGSWRFAGTEASTSATTGCATFAGGVGVAGAIYSGSSVVCASFYSGFGQSATQYSFFNVNSTSNSHQILFTRSGINRWNLNGLDGAETGSDAGTAFTLKAYNDSGTLIDTPLTITRASGGTITMGGTARTVATTGGRVLKYVVTSTTPTTLDAAHHVVVANSGSALTINLPAVATSAGREYKIYNKGAGTVTVDANASELIESSTTLSLAQYKGATLVCDGAIWVITGMRA